MSMLALAGPSSPLRSNAAEVRRVINWEPMRIESGTGKGGAQAYLKQVAGLKLLTNLGTTVRALKAKDGILYAVTQDSLVKVTSDWAVTKLGSLPGGDVVIDDNETQLGIICGVAGYCFDIGANVLSKITTNWPGSTTIGNLNGYGVLTPPSSNKFYLTEIEDFSTLDPLDFASAESSPGNIVATVVKHQQLLLLKERSGEIWYDSGGADFPLARDESAVIEVGCAAGATLCKVGGVAYWLGRDEDGTGIVFGMLGYEPQRVSSDALEERLATLTDLSGATAWVYHQEGQARYVLNIPGFNTTWVYNVSAGIWHERGEWLDGAWSPWRATCHAVAYGRNILADAAGNLYELSPTANTNAGDVLVREFISPHNAAPGDQVQTFASFEVIGDVGIGLPDSSAPNLMFRYSNDGGRTWGNWELLSLGAIGETQTRIRTTQLGSARDRVWNIRVTDDVMCSVTTVLVNEK